MTAPRLSAEQRAEGFRKAMAMRQARYEIREQLRRGAPLSAVWDTPAAQGMKVLEMIMAMPGFGPVRAQALLLEVGIPLANTVRRCGAKQTERLFRKVVPN